MILIYQRILPKFRASFFEKLALKIDFILCFYKIDKGLDKGFHILFKHEKIFGYFPFKKRESLGYLSFTGSIKKYKPTIVIVEFDLNIISLWWLILLRKFYKFKLVLWTQGYSVKKDFFDPSLNTLDSIRLWWYKKADKIIVYTSKGKRYLEKYITNSEKINVAHNTIDTHQLQLIRKKLSSYGIGKIKQELCIDYKYNLLFIGRLDKRKNPEKLIDIYKRVKMQVPNTALHYVGEGECRDIIKRRSRKEKLDGIFLWGAVYDDLEVSKLLYISDLVLIPGHVGLAVNHAFSMLTPVVTVEKGNEVKSHGPEIEYIENGNNGYIVPDMDSMPEVIVSYLTDRNLRVSMIRFIEDVTLYKIDINNMLTTFEKVVTT